LIVLNRTGDNLFPAGCRPTCRAAGMNGISMSTNTPRRDCQTVYVPEVEPGARAGGWGVGRMAVVIVGIIGLLLGAWQGPGSRRQRSSMEPSPGRMPWAWRSWVCSGPSSWAAC
jgi:hypothetical protein